MQNRKGFTLIELLIVVVIIGILAAIAIPKFANTKDKAKLASVKSDVRNAQSTEESILSDSAKYSSDQTAIQLSSGNSIKSLSADQSGYSITITNASISSGTNSCTVAVGDKASTTQPDGSITCP